MKKALSLVLAVVLIVVAAATVLAAPSPNAKITGMTEPLTVGYSGNPNLGDINPQDKRVEYIDLFDTMFTWDSHIPDIATPTSVPANILRNARVEVRANHSVLESVTLDTTRSRIEVKFVRELVNTKEIDFDFDVVLSINGRRQTDYPITFTGTLANPVYEVYANSEFEDTSRGEVVEAKEYIRSIVLDAGAGVKITTRMMNGDLMYAVAGRTPDSKDEDIFDQYKSIHEVIHLKTSGVNRSAVVKLDEEYRGYFIYDGEGKFLGMGSDELPLTGTYYLSQSKIDAVAETPVPANPAPAPTPEPAPVEGGPQPPDAEMAYPTNINDNPNTGR